MEVNNECRLLIRIIVWIEHCNEKGILILGYENYEREEGRWKVWSCRMNVTWYVYRVIIMNNQFKFQCAICICIPSHRHNDVSVAVTLSLTFLRSHSSNTIDISTVVMLMFCLFQFNIGCWAWDLCSLMLTPFFPPCWDGICRLG